MRRRAVQRGPVDSISRAPGGMGRGVQTISPGMAFLVGICVSFAACGYHTAGHANLLPSDLRTIAVPAFVNQTQTYKIEQTLTAAVVQEFTTRTKYHITADARSADAVLHGTVLSTYTTPLTYDTTTGRATT